MSRLPAKDLDTLQEIGLIDKVDKQALVNNN